MRADIYVIILLFVLILLLIGLFYAVWIDTYIGRKRRKVLLCVVVLVFTMLVQNYVSAILAESWHPPILSIIASIYGYCVRPIILLLFCFVVEIESRHKTARILVLLNTLINCTALFSDICFTFTASNAFHRGPLGYTCHVVSFILMGYLLYLTATRYKDDKRWDGIVPIFNVIVITLAVIQDTKVRTEYRISFLTAAMVVCSVLFYIWLNLRYVQEHEKDMRAQQRIQIMMTQIQPHFLFNTIATFRALCSKNPEKAAELADHFGQYLRQNMDTLDTQGCIPFEKELQHTKTYVEIEMVRFDHIRVIYDIQDTDFEVPPLTLQPMVENAIRHGVRIREEGIVRVKSRLRENYHEIIVDDNGVGFDVQSLVHTQGQHIGIRNVLERVENMCNGTVLIDSMEGEGTTVFIRIPVRGGIIKT